MITVLPVIFVALVGPPDPVKTRFVQVCPDHAYDDKMARSDGQKRAALLIHGLRPQVSADIIASLPKNLRAHVEAPADSFAQAQLSEWQRPGSLLVSQLGAIADVFSFAYGQDARLEKIVEGPALPSAIKRLKDLKYTEIIIVGHSAGGLLARLYVEDHASSGVTKLIQVCAPNGGSLLAHLAEFAPKGQETFLKSLTADARKISSEKRKGKKIPDAVQFLCVVGNFEKFSDGVVTCAGQWTRDLRRQGIPALELPTTHFFVMSQEKEVKKLVQLVGDEHPRWDAEKVRSFEKLIGDEEFSRGGFIAMVQSRATKAQKDGDFAALVECAYALAPFASPPGAKDHPTSVYLRQAANITLTRNDKQDANRFLEMTGALQDLLGTESKNKVTTLACGKNLDDMLKGEVVASLRPITKAGVDFFDPEVAARGGDDDIAAALGKAVLLTVRPTARVGKLVNHKIGTKKKDSTCIDIEMEFQGATTKHRAKMTITLAYKEKRARVVGITYRDDWQVPSERERIEEFKKQFNGK